jgi:hypothetical protein
MLRQRVLATVITASAIVGLVDRVGVSGQQGAQVAGVVRDARTREPVGRAQVVLSPVGGQSRSASRLNRLELLTTQGGNFTFQSVIPGRYILSAAKAGYVRGVFGVQRFDDPLQFFDVRTGEDANCVLWLTTGAVISGLVRTTTDKPAIGKSVRLIGLASGANGTPTLSYVSRGAELTNEKGEYRISGVAPGRYLVEVSNHRVGTIEQFIDFSVNLDSSFVFYPDARSPVNARPLNVSVGEDIGGIDFIIPDGPFSGAKVVGKVNGARFQVEGQFVRLLTSENILDLPPHLEIGSTALRSDGSFEFPYVPPGSYEIRGVISPGFVRAKTNPNDGGFGIGMQLPRPMVETPFQEPSMWFSRSITVRDDATQDASMAAQVGFRIRGHLTASSATENVDWSQVAVAAYSLDGWNLDGLPLGRSERDGRFSTAALPPGRYLVTPPRSTSVSAVDSVMFRGMESLGRGVEIAGADLDGLVLTMTQVKTQVIGAVRDRSGKDRPDARILFFRVNGAWQDGLLGPAEGRDVGSDRTDRFGGYQLLLAPGNFYLIAIEGPLPVAWHNAKFLQSLLPLATKVSLIRGAQLRADLVTQPIPR